MNNILPPIYVMVRDQFKLSFNMLNIDIGRIYSFNEIMFTNNSVSVYINELKQWHDLSSLIVINYSPN